MEIFNQSKYGTLSVRSVDISRIRPNPNQPRTVFEDEALAELAASIKEHGVLQPITVRKIALNEYELIAGERRLRASVLAGFDKIPAIVTHVSDEESSILALIENVQREDLNFFEEARAYRRLMDEYGQSQDNVAQMMGKSQPAIANKLRLLNLSDGMQHKILESGLSERHARALLRCESDAEREKVLQKVIDGGLSVAKTEELIDASGKKKPASRQTIKQYIRDIRIFTNTVHQAVNIMKKAGISAEISETNDDNYYEMVIRVPYHQ